VSWYQKGKTNLDFTEARDSEWQWHQLGHMQGCISLQTDNHANTPPLSVLQAACPSCRPTNSVKALKEALSILKCYKYPYPKSHFKDTVQNVTKCGLKHAVKVRTKNYALMCCLNSCIKALKGKVKGHIWCRVQKLFSCRSGGMLLC